MRLTSRFPYLILLIFFICSKSWLQAQNDSLDRSNHRLLWAVSHPDGQAAGYLFGSMHLRDRAVFQFPDSLFTVLSSCTAFANEVHFDSAMQLLMSSAEIPDTWPSYTPPEIVFDSLETQDSLWLEWVLVPEKRADLRRARVNAFADLIKWKSDSTAMPALLDAYLLSIAQSEDLRIYGLESIREQVGPAPILEGYESGLLDNLGGLLEYGRLFEAYLKGDIDEIYRILYEATPSELRDIERRNYIMANRMEAIFAHERLFSVVGAGHLGGPHGLIRILERRGYHLRPVTARFSQLAPLPAPRPFVREWQLYSDLDSTFQLSLPPANVEQFEEGSYNLSFVDIAKGLSFQFRVTDEMLVDQGQNWKAFMNENLPPETADTLQTGDWEVIEYRYLKGQAANTDMINYRLRTYQRGGRLFFLLANAYAPNQLNHPAVERFFNRFQPRAPVGEYTELKDTVGGYALRMPSGSRRSVLLYGGSGLNVTADRVYLYQGSPATGDQRYTFLHTAFGAGSVSLGDSVVRAELVSMLEYLYNIELDSVEYQSIGPHEQRAQLTIGDSVQLDLQLGVLGNRSYALAAEATSPAQRDTAFLDSFRQLPPRRQELEAIELTGVGTFYLPMPVFSDTFSYAYASSNYLRGIHYYSTDTLSSQVYLIDWIEYPPLLQLADTLFDEKVADFLKDGEVVLSDTSFNYRQGATAREIVVQSAGHSLQQRALFTATNQHSLQAYVYSLPEALNTPNVERFLRPNLMADTNALTAPKLDQLLPILASGRWNDTLQQTVEGSLLNPEQIARVASTLESLDFQVVPKTYLRGLTALLANTDPEPYSELYRLILPKLPDAPSIERLLRRLSDSPSTVSTKVLADVLPNVQDSLLGAYYLFDSLLFAPQRLRVLLPSLEQSVEKGILVPEIYFLLERALDAATLPKGELLPAGLIEVGAAWLSAWEPNELAPDAAINLVPVYVIDYYRATGLSDRRLRKQLQDLIRRWPNSPLGQRAIAALYAGGFSISHRTLQQATPTASHYASLLRKLEQFEALDALPERYYDPDRLARGSLLRELKQQHIEYANVQAIGPLSWSDQDPPVYYYRFTYFEGVEKRIAVVAGFPPPDSGQRIGSTYQISRSEADAGGLPDRYIAERLMRELYSTY